MSWIEKYKPKKIKDIINEENEEEINMIINWLKRFDEEREKYLNNKKEKKKRKTKKVNKIDTENEEDEVYKNDTENEKIDEIEDLQKIVKKQVQKSCICILGNHGCGKTCIVNIIASGMGYNIENINICKIALNKNSFDVADNLVNNINIFDSFEMNEKSKKIIIIDEVELISTQIEKKIIENLVKKNEEWFLPIIFVSSLKHSKIISLLKKNANIINLKQPTNKQLESLMFNIIKNEKLKLNLNNTNYKKIIDIIINYAQNDYRKLISVLQDLYKTYNYNSLTENNIMEYFEFNKKKDIDIEIYKSTNELMLKYINMEECYRLYSGEKVIIPLMIEQNYFKVLQKSNCKNIIKEAIEISESFSIGDIIENYIYSERNWDMQDVHCFYTCVYPSYKISQLKINLTMDRCNYFFEFPRDFNRTSIKFINKKNVVKANTHFMNMDINDFMCINSLTKMLYDDDKIDECSELYKSYGTSLDIFISVLKIDKLNSTKEKVISQQNIKKGFVKKF